MLSPQYNDQQHKPMASLQSLFSGHIIDTRTPRNKLIDIGSVKLNKKKSFIAFRISHLDNTDCDYLLKKCERSDNWGKCFNGLLKVIK